jgi:putative oxidoreductase
MGLIQATTRILLAGIFIDSGLDVVRHPEGRAAAAGPFIQRVGARAPVPSDPATVVRANAAAQVAAGTTLALGVAPRLSALALAASLVPTTLGGHRFWELEGQARMGQRAQFLKNAAILAGLLLFATRPRSSG